MLGAGYDARTVADHHGHADPVLTLRRYAVSRKDTAREAAAAVGRTIRTDPSPAALMPASSDE